MNERKVKYLLALVATLISSVIFYLCMAPTVSFWDCGEFIAVANILGIPHPPGTPFFVVMARTAIILFGFIPEIAARVNLISVICSGLLVGISFLIAWESLTLYFKPALEDHKKREIPVVWLKAFGSMTAAFLVGTADTVWFNAVEAEVYSASMFVMFAQMWLALKWVEHRQSSFGDRLLILICYIAFMGVGISLVSFMIVPMVFIFLAIIDERFRKASSWPIWVTVLMLYSIVWKFDWFIVLAVIATLANAVLLFVNQSAESKYIHRLSFWMSAVALIGFSNHAYVPIRALEPISINENQPVIEKENLFNPTKWTTFNNYITRKQYGSESMFSRASHRRGKTTSQWFTFAHIGLGGYQLAQWTPFKVGEIEQHGDGTFGISAEDNKPTQFLGMNINTQMSVMGRSIPMQAMWFILINGTLLYVCFRLYKRNKALGILTAGVLALGTYVLVYYMNFADGMGSEKYAYEQWVAGGKQGPYPYIYMEVRERDYFFTPGFIAMGIIFGMGLAIWLEGFYRNHWAKYAKLVGVSVTVLALVVPATANWTNHTRANNWLPKNYAYNLLMSCEPNSILFTNGDNDTFPLWFLQEVANIRKDVRVVNLSLGNTDWYIRQLEQTEPKRQLGMFLKEAVQKVGDIDPIPEKKNFAQSMKNELPKIQSAIEANVQKLNALKQSGASAQQIQAQESLIKQLFVDWQMFDGYIAWDAKDESPWLKVQDMLVVDLVRSNPNIPIHFASTVGPENFVGLDKFLRMDGMVYTLQKGRTQPIPQDSVLNVETTEKLVNTVFNYQGVGDGTTYVDDETQHLLYNYNAIYIRLAMQYRMLVAQARIKGDAPAVAQNLSKGLAHMENAQKRFPDEWRNFVVTAELYQVAGDFNKAKDVLVKGLSIVSPWNKEPIEQKLQEIDMMGKQGGAMGVPMQAPQSATPAAEAQ